MNNPEYICDVCSAPSDDVVTCAFCGNSFCGEWPLLRRKDQGEAMTTETKCLPGEHDYQEFSRCRMCGEPRPNAPKPPEAPKACECRGGHACDLCDCACHLSKPTINHDHVFVEGKDCACGEPAPPRCAGEVDKVPDPMCICGEPETPNVVHSTTGPCFRAPTPEPKPCGICKGAGFYNTVYRDRIRCPNLCGDPNPILPTKAPEPQGREEPGAAWERAIRRDHPGLCLDESHAALRAENERLKALEAGDVLDCEVCRHFVIRGRGCEVCRLRAELAAARKMAPLRSMSVERLVSELAAAKEEIAVRDASISDYARQMADIREHWHAEATENVTLKAALATARARFAHDIDSRDHCYALLEAERQRLHDALATERAAREKAEALILRLDEQGVWDSETWREAQALRSAILAARAKEGEKR